MHWIGQNAQLFPEMTESNKEAKKNKKNAWRSVAITQNSGVCMRFSMFNDSLQSTVDGFICHFTSIF